MRGKLCMSDAGALIVSTDLEGFFREQVTDARNELGIQMEEVVEFYLVNLLCDYSNPTEQQGLGDEPLALTYKRALEADAVERISILKELGDGALYTAGFFVESIESSVVDVDYYITMGGHAYSSLGNLVSGYARGNTFSEIYRELAQAFPALVNILNVVSEGSRESKSEDADLLRLYERWVVTKDPRLYQQLLEKGLLTAFDTTGEYEQ
jgi:hypothetical protein